MISNGCIDTPKRCEQRTERMSHSIYGKLWKAEPYSQFPAQRDLDS
jgi:hypothetical protein